MQDILLQILVYLAAAVIAVPITQRLGFGSVLGYLAAGVAIGPVFGLVGGAETETLQHFAEFGVVLMLFLIGLELEPKVLWAMRDRLIGLGGLQVGLTLTAVTAISLATGVPWNQSLAIGMILCLSSTAIVMQTLNEKRLARTEGGRASLAVLLFQDIAVLPFLAIMPLLAPWGAPTTEEHASVEMVAGLAPWMRALLVVGAVLLVIAAGRYLTHPIFRFLSLAGLHEIYVAATLFFVVAIAVLMSIVGLSPALGTFLAGVVLANSEYKHQIESDIAPFKGLLLGLFFITVGAGTDLGILAERPLRMLGLILALMALKLAILHLLAILFKLTGRDRLLFTLALAQAGEFGFFLTSFAAASQVLPPSRAGTVLMIISASMFLTPALFVLHDKLIARFGSGPRRPDDEIDEQGAVIIAGMGRFGQVVNRMVRGLGHKTVVIDSHPEVIEQMRRLGIKAFYGDVDRPALLEAAGLADATAIVLAIDDRDKAVRMASYVSRRHPNVEIIARARDRHHVYQLYAAGADESVREMFDGAIRAGKYALTALGYSEDEVGRIAQVFFERDRQMLAELAQLWDPDLPLEKNAAYIAKEREQAAQIEAALRGELEAADKAAE